jgi:peptidyl-prolyl cis-trans isomerase C
MRTLPCLFTVLALSLVAAGPHAEDSKEQARRKAVVAKVGTREITAGELEDRLAQVPRFQLAEFGGSADEIRKKFLNDIVVKDALLAQAAEDRKLIHELPTEGRISRALSSATLRKVKAESGDPGQISPEEVRGYYENNKARFDTPERVLVHRILCKTLAEAGTVIEAFKKDPTPRLFAELARDHSQDHSSAMRGGNLGFVTPDGKSNEAGVIVDPAVVKAALAVKDGDLVPQPIPEADMFAVVWRKGTIAAAHRNFEEVIPQIRDTIYKDKLEATRKKLIEDLRTKNVSEVNEPLLRTIDVSRADGAITPRKRPGQVPPLGAPIPEKKP